MQVFIFGNNIREQDCFLCTVAQQGSRDAGGGALQMCAMEFFLVPGSQREAFVYGFPSLISSR